MNIPVYNGRHPGKPAVTGCISGCDCCSSGTGIGWSRPVFINNIRANSCSTHLTNRNILQGSHHVFHNDNSVFKNAEASGGLNNACRINGTGGIVACALNLGKKRAGIDDLQRNVVGEILDNLSACSHVAMLRAQRASDTVDIIIFSSINGCETIGSTGKTKAVIQITHFNVITLQCIRRRVVLQAFGIDRIIIAITKNIHVIIFLLSRRYGIDDPHGPRFE
ncbi:Uncharacterised protein [Klebsiella quasipneumoniae]|nr:Uncharacterised protein [Klebsiella quasipneumoniae]